MTKEETVQTLCALRKVHGDNLNQEAITIAINAINAPTVNDWIPVKWHTITEEEREENGYPYDWEIYMDSVMPDDYQDIYITVKHKNRKTGELELTVEEDIAYFDDNEHSLDSGYDWADDVVAWMPRNRPKPYEPQESER